MIRHTLTHAPMLSHALSCSLILSSLTLQLIDRSYQRDYKTMLSLLSTLSTLYRLPACLPACLLACLPACLLSVRTVCTVVLLPMCSFGSRRFGGPSFPLIDCHDCSKAKSITTPLYACIPSTGLVLLFSSIGHLVPPLRQFMPRAANFLG